MYSARALRLARNTENEIKEGASTLLKSHHIVYFRGLLTALAEANHSQHHQHPNRQDKVGINARLCTGIAAIGLVDVAVCIALCG
jgi:hypothetical protein